MTTTVDEAVRRLREAVGTMRYLYAAALTARCPECGAESAAAVKVTHDVGGVAEVLRCTPCGLTYVPDLSPVDDVVDALEALAAQPEPPAPSGDVMERAREVLPKLGMIGAGNRAREATRALAAALQQYGDERVQQERARIGTWLRWVGIGWRKDGDTGKGSLLEGMATLIESDTYADCDDPREGPDA